MRTRKTLLDLYRIVLHGLRQADQGITWPRSPLPATTAGKETSYLFSVFFDHLSCHFVLSFPVLSSTLPFFLVVLPLIRMSFQLSCLSFYVLLCVFFALPCLSFYAPFPAFSQPLACRFVPPPPSACLFTRVVDPHSAFFVIADPDPVPVPWFWWSKIEKKSQLANFFILFWTKIAIYLSQVHHKGRPSYRRSLQPSKENIQHFKTWRVFNFYGTFFPSWIHIWIHILNADPDPATQIYAIRIRNHAF